MNTRPNIESPNTTQVLSVSFNNDSSCFAVGLNTGICDFNAGVGLVQMMGTTNYLALVGGGKLPKFASHKAIIWDDLAGKIAIEISTLSTVRGVQLSRSRIAIALQNSLRLYSFEKPPNLISVYETADNLLGLMCLTDNLLAFPGQTPGQIQLVNVASGNVSIIPAHSSALRAIQVSPDGELLATASETGTIIRVFATGSCAKIAELRRGIDPATIFSLAFSPSGTLLACTSDKSTLHVFDVPHPKKPPKKPANTAPAPSTVFPGVGDGDGRGKWGILGKIPLMPRVFSDVYSFASAPFAAGDETLVGGLPLSENITPGTSRPAKGLIGWVTEESLVVVGAGRDARWEKFVIVPGEDGRRYCVREGWKKYLGNN
ncbi:hypothetical protein jhhlp_004182 [Lomentospora prolificans]|uniref:Anaphase-promoting complex subunit 4 WD40 domain-containing protein n=1 Tax=Lomentospora prolificans TaxID=41688 RepID=A0A2N3NAT4_9PEZI|nr:hypothetical protein jhhlp_004182 [Lomentospora prolificans]